MAQNMTQNIHLSFVVQSFIQVTFVCSSEICQPMQCLGRVVETFHIQLSFQLFSLFNVLWIPNCSKNLLQWIEMKTVNSTPMFVILTRLPIQTTFDRSANKLLELADGLLCRWDRKKDSRLESRIFTSTKNHSRNTCNCPLLRCQQTSKKPSMAQIHLAHHITSHMCMSCSYPNMPSANYWHFLHKHPMILPSLWTVVITFSAITEE